MLVGIEDKETKGEHGKQPCTDMPSSGSVRLIQLNYVEALCGSSRALLNILCIRLIQIKEVLSFTQTELNGDSKKAMSRSICICDITIVKCP